MMMGFGGFGLLVMLFFFILIIGAAVALVSLLFPRALSPTDNASPRPQHPPIAEAAALDILNQRYARGELTRGEYETMKRDILAD